MGVSDLSTIDVVASSPSGDAWSLLAIQDISWSDPRAAEMVRAKLDRYCDAVDGGRLADTYPQVRGHRVSITLFCTEDPTPVIRDAVYQARVRFPGIEIDIARMPGVH